MDRKRLGVYLTAGVIAATAAGALWVSPSPTKAALPPPASDAVPAESSTVSPPSTTLATEPGSPVTAPPTTGDEMPQPTAARRASPPPTPTAAPSTQPTPSAPSAPALPAGTSTRQLRVGGATREYELVVPVRPVDAQRVALVVVLHGVGGRGDDMRQVGFEQLATPSGAIVAYPDALGGTWNDGRSGVDHPSQINRVDDIGFLRALIDDLTTAAGVDPNRVWMAGYSNGALMTSRAACELADRVSAVAMINGPGAAELPQWCHPARPLRVLLVHGTADPIVPYAGGAIAPRNGHARGASAPVMDIFTLWAKTNRCTARAESPASNVPITRIRAVGCRPGSSVIHYRLDGATHSWPNTASFSAARAAWDSFQDT